MIYQMSDWQYFQWEKFNDLLPLGEDRMDLHLAIGASSITNELRLLQSIISAANGGNYCPEMTRPIDFLPYVDREKKERRATEAKWAKEAPTTRSQFDAFKSAVRAMGEGMKRGTVQ